jgi:hypothetical protein
MNMQLLMPLCIKKVVKVASKANRIAYRANGKNCGVYPTLQYEIFVGTGVPSILSISLIILKICRHGGRHPPILRSSQYSYPESDINPGRCYSQQHRSACRAILHKYTHTVLHSRCLLHGPALQVRASASERPIFTAVRDR